MDERRLMFYSDGILENLTTGALDISEDFLKSAKK